MDKILSIGLTITALDKATPAISNIKNSLSGLSKTAVTVGMSMTKIGTIASGFSFATRDTAMSFIKPFTALEEARTQLENTLMTKDGKVSSWFEAINKEATALGDKLPGTTADFYQMASAMKALGVADETIAKGGLRAAAYLANVLKAQGVTYEMAAESIAKFKNALGIADKDLISFADDLQRMGHMGMKLEELKYAFGRSAGALKQLGIQGLEASRDLEPLFGMLLQANMSGETAGTAIGNALQTALTFEIDGSKPIRDIKEMLAKEKIVLDFVDDKGVFKGTKNFMAQLQKLEKLNPDKQAQVLKALFGKGAEGDSLALILKNGGVKALEDFKKQMAEQASLNQRVQNSLGTLSSLWEAFGGTMQNVFAGITETWSPELKNLTKWLGDTGAALGNFFKTHTGIAKFVGFIAIGMPIIAGAIGVVLAPLGLMITGFGMLKKITGFGAIKNALTGVGESACGVGDCAKKATAATGILSRLMSGAKSIFTIFGAAAKFAGRAVLWLGRTFLLNPIGLAITTIALGAYLIYRNWSKIKPYFNTVWSGVKTIFNAASNWMRSLLTAPINTVKNVWSKIKPWFTAIWSGVKTIFNAASNWMRSLLTDPINAVKNAWSKMFGWFKEKLSILGDALASVFFGSKSSVQPKLAYSGSKTSVSPKLAYSGSKTSVSPKLAAATVGGGYAKALNNGAVVTKNIKSASSVINTKSAVQNNSHTYHTTVHVHNPKSDVDIQKAVNKALKNHAQKQADLTLKGAR